MLDHIFKLEPRIMLNAASPAADAIDIIEHAETDPIDILIISDNIAESDKIEQAANQNVLTVRYNAETDSIDALFNKIENALERFDGKTLGKIGFAVHGDDGSFQLAENEIVTANSVNPASEFADADQIDFFDRLGKLIGHGQGDNNGKIEMAENARIDILACNVWSADNGQAIEESLELITGINFAFSSDITGNPDNGGDWLLESDNINLTDPTAGYFDEIKLADFEASLQTQAEVTAIERTNNTYFDGMDGAGNPIFGTLNEFDRVRYPNTTATTPVEIREGESIAFNAANPNDGTGDPMMYKLDNYEGSGVVNGNLTFQVNTKFTDGTTPAGIITLAETLNITGNGTHIVQTGGNFDSAKLNNYINNWTFTPAENVVENIAKDGDGNAIIKITVTYAPDSSYSEHKSIPTYVYIQVNPDVPPETKDVTIDLAKNTADQNLQLTSTDAGTDFNYYDQEGDPFTSIKITSFDSVKGTLKGTVNGTADSTITVGDEILVSDFATLTYSPDLGQSGSNYAEIGFVPSDGFRYNDTPTAPDTLDRIIINIANQQPTVSNIEVEAPKNSSYTFTEADFKGATTDNDGAYADADTDTFAGIQIVSLPTAGTLSHDNDGNGSYVTIATGDLNSLLIPDVTKLKYTPPKWESGGKTNDMGDNFASFTFKVFDGDATATNAYSVAKTAYIDVTNAAPTATAIEETINTNEDLKITETLIGFSDTTPDDALTAIKITTLPATDGTLYNDANKNGIIDAEEAFAANTPITIADIKNDQLKFKPDNGEYGTNYATFKFQVSDGNIYSADYNGLIHVNNAAPVSDNTAVSTNTDTPYPFKLTDFDFTDANTAHTPANGSIKIIDTSGVNVTLGALSHSVNDTISFANIANLTYTPVTGVYGNNIASFTFKVVDSDATAPLASIAYTATITVNNAAPGSANIAIPLHKNDPTYTFKKADFTFTDANTANSPNPAHTIDNGSIKIISTTGITSGALSKAANSTTSFANIGDLTYTPANGYAGSVTFTFKVIDDATKPSDATYTATINIVNDKPAITDDIDNGDTDPANGNEAIYIYTNETHTFTTADFKDNYTDANGDPISTIQITTDTAQGTLKHNGTAVSLNADYTINGLTYTPNTDKSGGTIGNSGDNYDSFKFKASDGTVYSDSDAFIYIDVTNRQPVATDFEVTKYQNTNAVIPFAQFQQRYTDADKSSLKNITITDISNLPAGVTLSQNGTPITIDGSSNIIMPGTDITFTYSDEASGYFTWTANDGTQIVTTSNPDANAISNSAKTTLIITETKKVEFTPLKPPVHDSLPANSTDPQLRTPEGEITNALTLTPPELPDVAPLNLYLQSEGRVLSYEILASEITFRNITPADIEYKAISYNIELRQVVQDYENKMESILFADSPVRASNILTASVTYNEIAMNTIYFLDNILNSDISEFANNKALTDGNNRIATLNDISIENPDNTDTSEFVNNKALTAEAKYTEALNRTSVKNIEETNKYKNTENRYYIDNRNNPYNINLNADINYYGNEMKYFDSITPDTTETPIDNELMLIHAKQIAKHHGMFNNFKKIAKISN